MTDHNMALEIAKLVKSLPLERGVQLIEDYARTVGTEMQIEVMDKSLAQFDQQIAAVAKEMSRA